METLGLSSERQQGDNLFQRLFWPTIREQEDVDLLGYQSFWLCFVLAVFSLLGIFSGSFYAVLALIGAFLYLGGACGVRQRSVTAACLMFALYLLNTLQILILAPGLGFFMLVRFVLLALLGANIRGTILAAKWRSHSQSEVDINETRTATKFGDKIANQMPPVVWPYMKWYFIPLASIAVVGMLVVDIAAAVQPRREIPAQTPPPSATYTVEPHG